MKANEFRIGNKVDLYGTIATVTLYDFSKGLAITEGTPIPLTEEWLLKMGFEIVWDIWFFKGFQIWQEDNNFFFELRDRGVMDRHIEYLHQLQNLYFALTNEELIIK